MVYHTLAEIDFALEGLPAMPRPRRVLLAAPDFFDVQYVINPHMEGQIGQVDRAEARGQWMALCAAYEDLSIPTHVVPGAAGLHDMVFCANQTLPFQRSDGSRGVVLSRMHAPQRRAEVPHFARFFSGQGYDVLALEEETDFEGMGDALWHPGHALLWGGHGIRTDPAAYDEISRKLGVPILTLRLDDPDFYHLDTCLSVLDARSALIYPGAFDADGLALLHHFFAQLIEAPEEEARRGFACNAHCPDEKHVLIHTGNDETMRHLCNAGFEPIEIDTSEFLKAGGSVFCMKQMFW